MEVALRRVCIEIKFDNPAEEKELCKTQHTALSINRASSLLLTQRQNIRFVVWKFFHNPGIVVQVSLIQNLESSVSFFITVGSFCSKLKGVGEVDSV